MYFATRNNLFIITLFALIPYIMESAFYWLPLTTDHYSDSYTTACVAIFGLWLFIAAKKQWLSVPFINFTIFFMIVLYFVWPVVTLAADTTLGFNAFKLSTFGVYSITLVITCIVMYFVKKLKSN